MYRVIIIDDEEEIRNGISRFISGMNSKFEVIATFEDGKGAIEFLEENDIEVVVTDIRMSDVLGLEVIKYIAKNKPYIKTVVISGYKDFEYVRTALENRAEYYITKPTRFKELAQTFKELEKKIDALKSEDDKKNREIEKMKFFKNEFLKDIYLNRCEREASEKKIQLLDEDYEMRDSSYCVLQLIIPDYESYLVQRWKYGHERFDFAVSNLINKHYQDGNFKCLNLDQKNGIFRYLIYFNHYESLEKSFGVIGDSINKLKDDFKELVNLNCVISVSNYYDNIWDFIEGSDRNTEIFDMNNDNIISRAKSYISKNISRDISLDEVAEHVHLSSVYFSKFFKMNTGENFSSFLTSLRINMAIELLKDQNLRISEIGERVGYTNYSYFTRIFKTSTGYTPSEYLRKVLHKYEK